MLHLRFVESLSAAIDASDKIVDFILCPLPTEYPFRLQRFLSVNA